MTGIVFWRLLAMLALIYAGCAPLSAQAAGSRPAIILRSPSPAPAPGAGGFPEAPAPRPVVSPVSTLRRRSLLADLAGPAGIIFSGRVILVERPDPSPSSGLPSAASTTITFVVEHAMRGVHPGQELSIHEWAGRWMGGERYRVGERVTLFLFPVSKLGLTSPVAGSMGRFPMDQPERILLRPEAARALAADPALGGRTSTPYATFERAVRLAAEEEEREP